MNWLWGAALVPVLLCGLMCFGGMILAFFGFRRAADGSKHDDERRTREREIAASNSETSAPTR